MSKLTNTNQKGFTIIEVVLALAIGAMIIGMVFIALPNLQKQRRDTARRNDLSRFMGQLEAYAGNNNGKYPADEGALTDATTGFIDKYVKAGGAVFEDPKAGEYDVFFATSPGEANSVTDGQIAYRTAAKCDPDAAENMADDAGNARAVAAVIKLERGNACLSNQ